MRGQWCWKSCLQGCAVGTVLYPTVPRQILEPVQSPPGVGNVPQKILPKRQRVLLPIFFLKRRKKKQKNSPNHQEKTHFSGNWNHCPCVLVLTWGVGLWLEVRDVFTQVHQSISPRTWWCIYNPLCSEASRGVKSRWMCKEGAEDWGAGVWHGVPCSSVLIQDMHSWHRELCCPQLCMENKTTFMTKKIIKDV